MVYLPFSLIHFENSLPHKFSTVYRVGCIYVCLVCVCVCVNKNLRNLSGKYKRTKQKQKDIIQRKTNKAREREKGEEEE